MGFLKNILIVTFNLSPQTKFGIQCVNKCVILSSALAITCKEFYFIFYFPFLLFPSCFLSLVKRSKMYFIQKKSLCVTVTGKWKNELYSFWIFIYLFIKNVKSSSWAFYSFLNCDFKYLGIIVQVTKKEEPPALLKKKKLSRYKTGVLSTVCYCSFFLCNVKKWFVVHKKGTSGGNAQTGTQAHVASCPHWSAPPPRAPTFSFCLFSSALGCQQQNLSPAFPSPALCLLYHRIIEHVCRKGPFGPSSPTSSPMLAWLSDHVS